MIIIKLNLTKELIKYKITHTKTKEKKTQKIYPTNNSNKSIN